MKRIFYISTLFFALISISSQAKAQDPLFEKLATAISQGNAAGITPMNATVELTIPGADGVYAANQAGFVLKDFFAAYKVTSFKIVHKGTSAGTSYATGELVTAKGNFDANIFVKNVNGQFVVTVIRFEAE